MKLPGTVQKYYIHVLHSSIVAKKLFSQLTDHKAAWFHSAKETSIRGISRNRNIVTTRQNYITNKMITCSDKSTFFLLKKTNKKEQTNKKKTPHHLNKIKHVYYLKQYFREGNSVVCVTYKSRLLP